MFREGIFFCQVEMMRPETSDSHSRLDISSGGVGGWAIPNREGGKESPAIPPNQKRERYILVARSVRLAGET